LNILFHEGVPVDFKNTRGDPCLFILDDLLNDVYSSGFVCDLFMKGSHRNICVILITQNIFHQSKNCCDISLNAKYFVLLKNVRDRSLFLRLAHLYQSIASICTICMYTPLQNRTGILYSIFLMTNDLLRFLTDIFPDESLFPQIYAPVDYEKDTIDVSLPTRS